MKTNPIRLRGTALVAGLLGAALMLAGCGTSPEDGAADEPAADEVADAPAAELTGDEGSDPTTEGPTDGADTRSFEAHNGEIEIPVDPERVVAINGTVGYALEFGVEPVGVTPLTDRELERLADDQLTAYDAATDVGLAPDLDYEAIAGLEPDLIVIHTPAHAWEGGSFDEERFQAIAPTVYVELDTTEWRDRIERLADVLGRSDVLEQQEQAYEQALEAIETEHGTLLDSLEFAAVNRWTNTDEGSFFWESETSYCTVVLSEAGVDLSSSPDGIGAPVSMEDLGELDAYDAIVYPVDLDGEPTVDFLPVIESNAWQSLAVVQSGRALGSECSTLLSYVNGTSQLESFAEALGTLSAVD